MQLTPDRTKNNNFIATSVIKVPTIRDSDIYSISYQK